MSNTLIFSSYVNKTSQENLDLFINMCRNELTVFGEDLDFNENIWDITKTQPGKQNSNNRIYFSCFFDSINNKKKKFEIVPMLEPFLSFAKSYVRYKYGLRPIKNINTYLSMLRLVENSLIELKLDTNPINVDSNVLSKAIELGNGHYKNTTFYRICQKLEDLGKFLNEKNISKVYIDWKNPIKRPTDTQRVGKKADENRNKKMPSKKALDVLPEIFFKAKDSKDLMVISVIALLLGAPNRIGEVFLLPNNCEVIQKDSNNKEQYGLRWYPEKGAKPMIKWIIPSMVDTVKLAIHRIKELTIEARVIAKWYEKNPTKIYLNKELEFLRDKKYLSTVESSNILYGKNSSYMTTIYKHYNIPYIVENKSSKVLFVDFEKAIINLLPINFPYIDQSKKLKYSETLIIQRKNEYNSQKSVLIPTIEDFSIGFINDSLGARADIESIFKKFEYKESDGSDIKVTSHQFRHYLNTLAQKGGASQLDIAKWSGRKDIKQNEYYDHVTADEMLQLVHKAIGDKDEIIGPLSNIDDIKKKVVISRDEYAQLKIRTAHRTEFGICIHDFTMMPCQLHRDCLNCTDLICMKGDGIGNENIRNRKNDVKKFLETAQTAHNDGHMGANRWVEHHSLELIKLNQLCDILDNPNVPNNSFIQISNISVSSKIEQSQNRRNDEIKNIEQEFDMYEMKNLFEKIGE